MSARERILDAYQSLLAAEGERAATLEAVAARAEVSKGGLLYHFRDKAALAHGLVERMRAFAEEDMAAMAQAPEGPARYYVRTSAYEGTPFDRCLVAVLRLNTETHSEAARAFAEMHRRCLELIRAEVGDPARAWAVMLMGDGLYYDAALRAGTHAEHGAPGSQSQASGTVVAAGTGATVSGDVADRPADGVLVTEDLLAVVDLLRSGGPDVSRVGEHPEASASAASLPTAPQSSPMASATE